MGRFACLLVPDVPLAAALRADPELRGKPLAIVDGPHIVAGWLRGLTVTQARTVRPDLLVRFLSLEGIHSAQQALLDVATSVTPRVEDIAPGCVALDVEGTEALFPTERGLLTALESRLGEVGLDTARSGIGPTRTVALLAARHREGGYVVTPEHQTEFLAPLPLDLLDPPGEVFERLTRWGIYTLGDLVRIPRDALGARLGKEGVQLARRAHGEDLDPFRPAPPRLRFEEGTETDYPVGNLETLAFLLRGPLDRLTRRLRMRGLAARELLVELVLQSGDTFARPVGMGAPTVEVSVLVSLARLALEKDPPREPVERLRVIATPGSVETAQLDLFLPPLPAPAELAMTVTRLEALCGAGRIGAAALDDTHRPDAGSLARFATRLSEDASRGAAARAATPTLPRPVMALRALRPPRRVRVAGEEGVPERVELPDSAAHGVLRRAGPWRLFGEWWGESRFARDYFDVELTDGGVYRLYRNLEDRSWYVDGIYD